MWVAPVITSVTSPGAAASAPPPPLDCRVYWPFFADADQQGPLTCQASNPQPQGSCVVGDHPAEECAQVISATRTGSTISFCVQTLCRDLVTVYYSTASSVCSVLAPTPAGENCYTFEDPAPDDPILSFQLQLECGAECAA